MSDISTAAPSGPPSGPAPSGKVSLRTLTIIKHALIGLGLGLVPVVFTVMAHPHQPVGSRGALVGSIIGGALGGMTLLTLVGAYRARSIPPEQPSPIGRVRLALGLAPLALIILGLGVLSLL
ncbi:hypothetical protein [Nitrospirillum sp. BR 11163]|uniref:hypothetical protein n=1 Tax=Nitrospirillum sp. BR 11163 TaxID=3104323 RepID=UPI002AFE8FE4|nr:hypothetical protein [Nitrospirillum sp. BR 11163]MEA1676136.1 hypothetical protein [Nitrospirillum sp. BR 11163]